MVASQVSTLPVLSSPLMRLPSGLHATLDTLSVCPLRERGSWPLSASHTISILSSLPATMRSPSGLHASLPATMRLPSGLNATLVSGACAP